MEELPTQTYNHEAPTPGASPSGSMVQGALAALESGIWKPGDATTIAACLAGETSLSDDERRGFVALCPDAMQGPISDALGRVKPDPEGLHRLVREADEWNKMGTEATDSNKEGSKSHKPPIHRQVADWLMTERDARFVAGCPVVSKGLYYEAGMFEMEREISFRFPDLKKAQRSEAMALVSLEAPRDDDTHARYIGFENGILDIETMTLHTDGVPVPVTNKIPHRWNPDAMCSAVDAMLDSVSCGDRATRTNLEECMGHCLYRGNELQGFWVLTGCGANGKSTFLAALANLLGSENYSAMQPEDLAKQFQGATLVGKLAVLADDASSQTVNEGLSAALKRISAGNLIHSDVKYHAPIDFRPYCAVLVCYNTFPSIKSNDHGFMRRLWPIPFDARFEPGTDGYDPHITRKVCTEAAAERLAVLAVAGLRRLLGHGTPTFNARAEAMKADIRLENDSIAAWVDLDGVQTSDVEGLTVSDVRGRYVSWCEDSGMAAKSPIAFTRAMKRYFGVVTTVHRVGDRTLRIYVSQ